MGSRGEDNRRDDECQDRVRRDTTIVDPDRVSGNLLRPSLHPRPYQMLQMSAIRPYVKNVSPATFNVRHLQRQAPDIRLRNKKEGRDRGSQVLQLQGEPRDSIQGLPSEKRQSQGTTEGTPPSGEATEGDPTQEGTPASGEGLHPHDGRLPCSGTGSEPYVLYNTRIQISATQSSGRSNYGTDHHCHINGQTGPGPHPKYDDQKVECKERQNKGLPGKTESEDYGHSHRISRTNEITVSSCSSEPILVTGFHTPLHETNEDDSDSGSQEIEDPNSTNSQGSANFNSSDSSCSIQSRRNVVGDSHLPDQQEESSESDTSETAQSKITPHLRATHCVVSSKTKMVSQEAKKNSVNMFNVVEDSFVTNPNITHTLPHLRATHCVTSPVCDGTDTSETEFQDHENTSSSDSSCSNQSCNNVVGDSHLQDQQEESDEEDSDESKSNAPTENETETGQSKITKNSVKIVHWNTQGANGKVAEIQAAVIDHDIDILLLQDTRFKPMADWIAPLRVDGYHTYHIPLREEPTKSHGLITLVHHRLPSAIMGNIDIGQSTEVLSVKIWINKRPLDIHNVYKTEPFPINLEPILSSGHRILIAGDYNARHESWCRATNASGSNLRYR